MGAIEPSTAIHGGRDSAATARELTPLLTFACGVVALSLTAA